MVFLFISGKACYNSWYVIKRGMVTRMCDRLDETFISREDKFQGKIVSLHVDRVRLPNGAEATREVVDHGGGVAVLPGGSVSIGGGSIVGVEVEVVPR